MADLASQQSEQERDKAIRLAREKHLEALRKIVAAPEGRYYLGYLVEQSGVLERPASLMTGQLSYDAGRRDMGLLLMDELQELGQPGQPAGHLAKLIGTIKRVPKPTPRKTESEEENDG